MLCRNLYTETVCSFCNQHPVEFTNRMGGALFYAVHVPIMRSWHVHDRKGVPRPGCLMGMLCMRRWMCTRLGWSCGSCGQGRSRTRVSTTMHCCTKSHSPGALCGRRCPTRPSGRASPRPSLRLAGATSWSAAGRRLLSSAPPLLR